MWRDARFLKRWVLLACLAGILAVASVSSWQLLVVPKTQPSTLTVGILNPNPAWEPAVAGFKASLEKLGFRQGAAIRYLYAGPLTKMELLGAEASRLAGEKIDLLFSVTTPATVAAKKAAAGTGIPIVFAPVTDPVESGLVAGLRSSGGNLTGVQSGGSTAKALEWLQSAGRKVSRVLVVHDPEDKSSATALRELELGAAKLSAKLTVHLLPPAGQNDKDFDRRLRNADALFLLPASRWIRRAPELAAKAIELKVPTVATSPVEGHGVLVVYGADPFLVGSQAGRLAAQVLRGVPASDLPVERSEFTLRVNLRTARAIGLKVPDPLLIKADRVLR